jgi:hypothetical protein
VGAGGKPVAHAFLHSRGEWDVEPRADDCCRRRSSGLDLHALLLVAVVGVVSGRDVATTAALYVWARLSGPLDVTLLSRAAMPATAETRFVRSAG